MPNLEQTGCCASSTAISRVAKTPKHGEAAIPRSGTTTRAPAEIAARCSTSCAATWPSMSSTSARTDRPVRRLSRSISKSPGHARARAPPTAGVAFPDGQARPAAQQRVHVGRGQFGRFLIPVPQPARQHQDRRCAGDHHGSLQHPERDRLLDSGRVRRRNDVPGYRCGPRSSTGRQVPEVGAEDRVRGPSTTRKGRGQPVFRELYRV